MSRPDRASGMAAAWMGVGRLKLSFSHASQSWGIIPREEKVGVSSDMEVGVVVEETSGSGGMVEGLLKDSFFV